MKTPLLKNFEDKLMVLAIQIIMTYTWVLSGWPKLTDSGYRENFEKRFIESFLATLPGGISPQVFFLGTLQLLAAILFVVSIFKLEFRGGGYTWIKRGLATSALIFVFLGFGLRVIKDFQGFANIFFYLSGVVVFYVFVERLSSRDI
jgi:hypothetical protein